MQLSQIIRQVLECVSEIIMVMTHFIQVKAEVYTTMLEVNEGQRST